MTSIRLNQPQITATANVKTAGSKEDVKAEEVAGSANVAEGGNAKETVINTKVYTPVAPPAANPQGPNKAPGAGSCKIDGDGNLHFYGNDGSDEGTYDSTTTGDPGSTPSKDVTGTKEPSASGSLTETNDVTGSSEADLVDAAYAEAEAKVNEYVNKIKMGIRDSLTNHAKASNTRKYMESKTNKGRENDFWRSGNGNTYKEDFPYAYPLPDGFGGSVTCSCTSNDGVNFKHTFSVRVTEPSQSQMDNLILQALNHTGVFR